MHHLQILPLGVSVNSPSAEQNVICVCVTSGCGLSVEGFLSSLKSVFSLACVSTPPPLSPQVL